MTEPRGAADLPVAKTSDSTRLLGFSDAFFPIVITLLVIEIHRPDAPPGELANALWQAWPSYAAFILAFVYVGVIWMNHQGLFRRVQRVDTGLHWINLGILGAAALIPFPTGVLAEALQSGNLDDQRAAVVLYGLIAALMSAAWAPVFPYLERRRELLASEAPAGYFAAQTSRPWVGVGAYAVAIAAGLLTSPWVSVAIFVLIVVFHAATSEGLRGSQAPSIKPGSLDDSARAIPEPEA